MENFTKTDFQSWVAAYQSAGIGLTAPNGERLDGFRLDRATIEALLSDTSVTGIQIHLAKNPRSAPKDITLMFTPVKPLTMSTAAMTAGTNDTVPGDPPPCPTMCP